MKDNSYFLTKLARQRRTILVKVILHLQGLSDSLARTLRVIEKAQSTEKPLKDPNFNLHVNCIVIKQE